MITVEQHGAVLEIRLARPEKRNALTPEMFARLTSETEIDKIDYETCRALMLSGEGAVFCGGFDLQLCLDQLGTLGELLMQLGLLVQRMRILSIPVVVAAHGAAIAGGCALLSGADYVVTNDESKIGYPVVPLGISPAVSAATLRLAVGDGWCRERLLDPALISGREAVRIGLAHESVQRAEEVRPVALERARGLAEKPAPAIRQTKRWLREIEETLGPEEAGRRSLMASLAIADKAEQQERLARLFRR
jgi:enoyl-CoA hydratase/carnithine racemase